MNSITIIRIITAGLVLFLSMGILVSCSESIDPTSSGGTGTLRMFLVDAPAGIAAVDSLKVVFEEVLVHRGSDGDEGEGEWITVLHDTLAVEERTFDLMQLVNGVFATLGEMSLEAGTYTQIRIIIESATIVVDGVPYDLAIPSGTQTGIKLVRDFRIEPNVITELILDFDIAQSLHESPPGSGNYKLKPTIRVMQVVLSGTISGTVTPTGIGAVVYALDPATADTVTTTIVDPDTGEYVLQALLAGTYDVLAGAAGYADSTRTGITVTAGQDTPGIDFELILIDTGE